MDERIPKKDEMDGDKGPHFTVGRGVRMHFVAVVDDAGNCYPSCVICPNDDGSRPDPSVYVECPRCAEEDARSHHCEIEIVGRSDYLVQPVDDDKAE